MFLVIICDCLEVEIINISIIQLSVFSVHNWILGMKHERGVLDSGKIKYKKNVSSENVDTYNKNHWWLVDSCDKILQINL